MISNRFGGFNLRLLEYTYFVIPAQAGPKDYYGESGYVIGYSGLMPTMGVTS